MKKIDYKKIIRDSFDISWKNKTMWIFGLFIFLGQAIIQISPNKNSGTDHGFAQLEQSINNLIQQYPLASALIAFFILTLIAIIILFGLISKAAIIKMANNITVYRNSGFRSIFSECKKFVWKFLFLDLVIGFILFSIMLIVFLPVAYLFSIKSTTLAIIILLLSSVFILTLFVLGFYLIKFSQIFIVFGDLKIKTAIESAYNLFEKNIKKSLFFGLILLLLNIAIIFPVAILVLSIALFSLPIGLILNFLLPQSGMGATLLLAIFFITVSILTLLSWFESFLQTSWVLYFQQIALTKKEEQEKKEEHGIEVPLPDPEAA